MGKIFLTLILLTTTSVQDSGLLDKLIPEFKKIYRYDVKVIAVGTGAAFRLGREGTGDLLIVHDKDGEEKFVEDGYGVRRYPFMWNEFVLCGPKTDPAGIKNVKDVFTAFKKIYLKKAKFISRGDNSGTNRKEIKIWKKIGIKPKGNWYIQSGNGMIETLRIAEEKNAYVLSDISTFIFHRKEFSNIEILLRDKKNLKNVYSLILISPAKFKWINYDLSMKFVKFIREGKGREIIKNYGKNGFKLFNLIK